MNIELLQKVRKLIAEEPNRLNMRVWGRKTREGDTDPPPCGTVACLAGWIMLASTPEEKWGNILGPTEATLYDSTNYRGVAETAASLVGINRWNMPFMKAGWSANQVLEWLDKTIAEGQSQTQPQS